MDAADPDAYSYSHAFGYPDGYTDTELGSDAFRNTHTIDDADGGADGQPNTFSDAERGSDSESAPISQSFYDATAFSHAFARGGEHRLDLSLGLEREVGLGGLPSSGWRGDG